jgi:hypothetical protein
MAVIFTPLLFSRGVKITINGAFATPYFILFNINVCGTITAQGRDLTKTMDRVN